MFEFPAHYIGPLIKLNWQITPTSDPLSISRVHDSFGGGTNSNWFSEIRGATLSDPGYFWSKSFNMSLLFEQSILRDENREVSILDSIALDNSVEIGLNFLPNIEAPWTQNIASRDIVVLYHS